MLVKLVRIAKITLQSLHIFLWAISPMAALLLIVALIAGLDQGGAHRLLRSRLEANPQTAAAVISGCHPDSGYCFADFVDSQNQQRYGVLQWRYYAEDIQTKIMNLPRGTVIQVRYAAEIYENQVVLADHFQEFYEFKGHIYDVIGLGAISWVILMLHPETLLFMLVPDMGARIEQKWKRMLAWLR